MSEVTTTQAGGTEGGAAKVEPVLGGADGAAGGTTGGGAGSDAAQAAEAAKATEAAKAAAAATPEAAAAAKAAAEKVATEKAASDAKALEAKTAADKAAADEKAKADASAADKSWAEWKPKPVDGVTLNESQLKEFVPLARELGLKPEQADKLVAFQGKAEAARAKAATEALQAEVNGWMAASKADKEIGAGSDATLQESMRAANKALEKYVDADTVKFLKASGMAAHPGLVRAFVKIGKALKNDTVAGTAGNGAGAPSADDIARTLYPKSYARMTGAKP